VQRSLVISRGRHDRNTSKSERKPQPRPQFEHPYQQATQPRPRPRRRQPDDEGDDDKEEELGWWQQPKKASTELEADELEEWQVEKLEEAFAIGRRKVAVSTAAPMQCTSRAQASQRICRAQAAAPQHLPQRSGLAATWLLSPPQIGKLSDELQLDRSFIIGWLKDFGQRPARCAAPSSCSKPRPSAACLLQQRPSGALAADPPARLALTPPCPPPPRGGLQGGRGDRGAAQAAPAAAAGRDVGPGRRPAQQPGGSGPAGAARHLGLRALLRWARSLPGLLGRRPERARPCTQAHAAQGASSGRLHAPSW
jgi:hypothetical protein